MNKNVRNAVSFDWKILRFFLNKNNILATYPYGVYNLCIKCHNKKGCEGMEDKQECCCHKIKERSEKEYKDLIHRLNRIEGQIRGIKGMVEKNSYCTDILTQVAAVNAALNSFNRVLLENHIKTCVTNDIREGKEETVDELLVILQKLMK